MSYSMPARVTSPELPATLVRSSRSLMVRTARACAAIDPAAVLTAVAALPALSEGVATLVQRMALVADRVDEILDGVEGTQRNVDVLVGTVTASSAQALADIELLLRRVNETVGRTDVVLAA